MRERGSKGGHGGSEAEMERGRRIKERVRE